MAHVAGRPLTSFGARIFKRYLCRFGYPSVLAHLLHPVALRLLDVQPHDMVLDAGCGKALLATDLRVESCRGYRGIDAIFERVAHARHIARHLTGRCEFTAMDLANLGFGDGAFTKVVCLEVLEHIDDDEHALREIFRVLKPGGRLVLSTSASTDDTPLKVITRHRDHARSGYTRAALERKVRAAGLHLDAWIPFRGARADAVFSVENAFVSRNHAWVLPALFPLLSAIALRDNVTEQANGYRGHLIAATRPA